MRKLLNQICEEWNALKDSKEIEIARKYGMFTRRFTEALLRKELSKRVFFDIDRFTIALVSKSALDKFFLQIQAFFSVRFIQLACSGVNACYSDYHQYYYSSQ